MKVEEILMQLFSGLEAKITAEFTAVRDEMRDEGKRRDAFVMTMDTANKAEFAAVKGMVRDVERSITSLASREDLRRIDDRMLIVEKRQTENMPLFVQLQEKFPKLEGRVDSLETDKKRAEGAWLLGRGIWALIGGSAGLGALAYWWLERMAG